MTTSDVWGATILAITITIIIIMLGGKALDDHNKALEAKGIKEGQCAQMYWFLKTDSLKDIDKQPTQDNFDDMCRGVDY